MLYLTPDSWHGYLTPVLDMLYLTPDLWHMISDTSTWHVILDSWSLTLDIWHWYLICYTRHRHLIYDIWHLTCFHMVLVHLTWYWDTWLDTIVLDTCIILYIHDYHFYGDLAWLLYCYLTSGTPELLCSWTPVFMNPCNRETPDIILLMPYSCWSP